MKQPVKLHNIVGKPTTATIIINKDGLSVVDKSEPICSSTIIRRHITKLIDMDDWKHSWHIDVSKAQFKSSDERKNIRKILNDKIKERELEIEMLKNGINILGRWNINTN